jgi:ribonuclease BN (tRNA processing enzyme)
MRFGVSRDLMEQLRDSHTELSDVEKVAREVEVGTTVLSHLIPAYPHIQSQKWWQRHADKTFSGPVLVGHDGLNVPMEPRR